MYDILNELLPAALGFIIGAAVAYYYSHGLSPTDKNKLICCIVKKYAPNKYEELEQDHPEVVVDCSDTDNCAQILKDAKL